MAAAGVHQLDIAQRMGLAVVTDPVTADVAVDALVGYGLTGQLRGRTQRLALAMKSTSGAVISLDAPTGLDTSTGATAADAVLADATVTLCLPKIGLADADAVGQLFLADISVPPEVTERIGGRPAPPFRLGPVLQLRVD